MTRGKVIQLCRQHDVPLRLGDFTTEQARSADEAFVTGTFGGITPAREIDGRRLPGGPPGPVTQRIRELYEALKNVDADAAGAQARDRR